MSGPLEAGETLSLSYGTNRTYKTYALPEGIYTVGVKIDPLDGVAEQREDDNLVWVAHRRLYVGIRPTRSREWTSYP